MKSLISITLIIFILCSCSKNTPIENGEYLFQQKYAEHPYMQGLTFNITISYPNITVINKQKSSTWPIGIIESGELFFHEHSKQWVIIRNEEEKKAKEVGGCSDGPTAIDLQNRIYWSC